MLTLIIISLLALLAILGLVAIGCRVHHAMTRQSRISAWEFERVTGLHCREAGK